MGISAAGASPALAPGASQKLGEPNEELQYNLNPIYPAPDPELAIILQSAQSATALTLALLEGVSPLDPKYSDIAKSGKTPGQLFGDVFESVYVRLAEKLRAIPTASVPEVRTQRKRSSAHWGSRWDPPVRK